MAKGNMLLGHARGKVGDLVFSRQNGQQVTRARAAVVRNPQTEAQMIQRIIMNTVAQAYSKMSAITDHSYEGIEAGQKSMSHFLKVNIKNVRQRIQLTLADGYDFSGCYAFTQIGANYFAANQYTVAKGQLPEIQVTGQNVAAMVTSITANEGMTYQDLLDATGLKRGDQLTFLCVSGTQREGQFFYARIILDPHNEDGTAAELTSPFLNNGDVNLPSPKNEGTVALSISDGHLAAQMSGQELQCAAVIASRKKADGTWMRSNSTMYVSEGGTVIEGMSLQDCLDAFYTGGIDVENPMYLNNAGTQGSAVSSAPVVITDREITAVSVGGVALSAGDHESMPSGSQKGAVAGTLTGNRSTMKVYAVSGLTTKPAVGGTLPSGAQEMTISGQNFSGSISWGDSMPGEEKYCGFIVAEDNTIKQVWCTYHI